MGLSFFPAFFDSPSRIRLAYQEEDEHIELLLRQHWFTNIGWIITALLAFISPVSILGLGWININFLTHVPSEIVLSALILWYMLVLAFVVEKFLFWYFNIYVVTDHHLIDVISHSLMSRDITEARIDDVQSAKSQVRGVAGSLFNFGDVVIETAAKQQKIEFISVPNPDFVSDRIQDLRRAFRLHQNMES